MRSLVRRTGKGRGSAEEFSIVGVILLLFGVSWAAYAYVQPVVHAQGGCSGMVNTNPFALPPCTSLSGRAVFFYSIAAVALVIGSVLLFVRTMIWVEDRGRSKAEKGAAQPQAGPVTVNGIAT